jgi:nucleoside-diphosphate kinase
VEQHEAMIRAFLIALAFVARLDAKELETSADKLADDLFDRAVKTTSSLFHEGTGLENATLGKAGQLSRTISPSGLAGSHVNPNPRAFFRVQALAQPPRSSLPLGRPKACSCPAPSSLQQGQGRAVTMAVLAGRALPSPAVRSQALSRSAVVRASASAERTYVMVKPDGVQRGLVGEILSRFERKGFTLKGLKLFQCPEDLAKEHYGDLSAKPFFPDLVGYICSGPVVCMIWEGKGVVASARKLIGATNPLESEPGTIRGDFAVEVGRNVIHGSDSVENGEREIGLWFGSGEGMAEWKPAMEPWLRE